MTLIFLSTGFCQEWLGAIRAEITKDDVSLQKACRRRIETYVVKAHCYEGMQAENRNVCCKGSLLRSILVMKILELSVAKTSL